mgnify:CR=1 FL=1
MNIKRFKLFESDAISRLDALKQCFFNIEEFSDAIEVEYEVNSKNYYTITIDLEELKLDTFSDIIKSKTTQIEILKLISKNIQKIEENIDFDIKRDLHINFNGNKDSISIEIHYGVLDVKIEDVIVITESEEELSEFTIDHSMLKLFFKNNYGIDVNYSEIDRQTSRHGDSYDSLLISTKQNPESYRDIIIDDFSQLDISVDFISELSIVKANNGTYLIEIVIDELYYSS